MSLRLERAAIEEAYREACRLDVAALKPGNVHVFAAGHRMSVADFTESARVSAPFVADPALMVGERIRRSVEATFEAVGCNTNLGILLLSAPLAMAAALRSETAAAGPPRHGKEASAPALAKTPAQKALAALRASLNSVLDSLTHDDAREVYRAIARASPAGLGDADEADVRHEPPPGLTLLDAMRLAADRDLVARQYATGFDLVLDVTGGALLPVLAEGLPADLAVSYIFLQLLAVQPDTHIARKHGPEAAEDVALEATEVLSDLRFCSPWDWTRPEVEARLLAFDAGLKARSLNPGALADVMVAIAFAGLLATKAAIEFTS
jgi:triphosphoribosyl-dephospho-CoA synthase